MLEPRVAQMRITPKHADFLVAAEQSNQVRRLRNSLNYVARAVQTQRKLNREHNHSVKDKRKLIKNPHRKIDAIFKDPILVEMGVVKWLRKNRGSSFTHQFAFHELALILSAYLELDLNRKIVQRVGAKLAESWKSNQALWKRYWRDPTDSVEPGWPGYTQRFALVEYTRQAIRGGQSSKPIQENITRVAPTGWGGGGGTPRGVISRWRLERATRTHS